MSCEWGRFLYHSEFLSQAILMVIGIGGYERDTLTTTEPVLAQSRAANSVITLTLEFHSWCQSSS